MMLEQIMHVNKKKHWHVMLNSRITIVTFLSMSLHNLDATYEGWGGVYVGGHRWGSAQ